MKEKIIGFKFGIDDRVADAKDTVDNVKEVEEALAKLRLNIAEVEATVSAQDLHTLWFFLISFQVFCPSQFRLNIRNAS
jgi:hypothetical protein